MTKLCLIISILFTINLCSQEIGGISLKYHSISIRPEYKWNILADDSLSVLISEDGNETVYIYSHNCKTGYELETIMRNEYNFGDSVSLIAAYRPKFTDGDIYVVDVEGFRKGASILGRAVGILNPGGKGFVIVGVADERHFRPDFKFVPYRLLKTIKGND